MDKIKIDKKKYLNILIIFGCIVLITLIGTYALKLWTSTDNTELTFRIGDYSQASLICKSGEDVTISNIGPVFDYLTDGEVISFSVVAAKSNTKSLNINFNISSISDNLKDESFKYVLLSSTDKSNYNEELKGSFVNSSNNTSLTLVSNKVLTTNTYYKLIIYIDGNMENSTSMQNGSLTGNVEMCIEGGEEQINASLQTLTNLGLSVSEGTPDFSKTSCTSGCDETTVGIYKTQDNLGDTYYFRGDVENNYVYFAGFYWRIIRINGDGSVRMIYDGTSAHDNGESSTDRYMGHTVYNTNYNDNAYVGYMYGTVGSSTYEATHANTNDSTMKTYLDNWYKTNIYDAGYSSYVVDAIYCNDRSLYSGTGKGVTTTYYKGYLRNEHSSPIPTLKCSQANDKFTVSSDLGNGSLEYPIGLITADEVAMAGGVYNTSNSSYYLYAGSNYWTMTTYGFFGSKAQSFFAGSSGDFGGYYVVGDSGCRGVISISSSAIQYGDGSKDNPFRITSAI